jgi:hypothetical protein
MKKFAFSCILVFSIVLVSSSVTAEDFYVIPVKGQVTSWDKKISGPMRFKLVLDDEAVLDRETGLVWERSPDTQNRSWVHQTSGMATTVCTIREVGGRFGWRLPAIEELASLVDADNSYPALPTGHPFENVQPNGRYWSATTIVSDTSRAWEVWFGGGAVSGADKTTLAQRYVWCVRGGYGYDAY